MHVMQYIATMVETDDLSREVIEDYARESVNSWLNDNVGEYNRGSWSDWASVGGRWENIPILIYSDENACEFLEALDLIDLKQISQFNEYFAEFDFPTINSLMIKFGNGETVSHSEMYHANLYSFTSALKIMQGYWNWDSGYYDTINDTIDTDYLRKTLTPTLDKPSEDIVYCLVPVDFHF